MLTEEDMGISSTQVCDGEETAAAVSMMVTAVAPVVAVPLSQSSKSGRNKGSDSATTIAKSKEDRRVT